LGGRETEVASSTPSKGVDALEEGRLGGAQVGVCVCPARPAYVVERVTEGGFVGGGHLRGGRCQRCGERPCGSAPRSAVSKPSPPLVTTPTRLDRLTVSF